MDITSRKYQFIEEFMKIVTTEKLERFEQFLRSENSRCEEIVAYTIQGNPLTKANIIENNKEAINSIKKGEFKTHTEMRQKYAR